MSTDVTEITPKRPAAYGPEVTIRFFPEYSAPHPLWFWFDYPALAALQLPRERRIGGRFTLGVLQSARDRALVSRNEVSA